MSTKDSASTPEAFLPEAYDGVLMESFILSCGVAALIMMLGRLEEEEAHRIKEMIIAQWRTSWQARFKGDIGVYNEILADSPTTKTEDLPQPEEYQLGFNRALAQAERVARQTLGMKEGE